MHLEGAFDVGADKQTVFDFLVDPGRVTRCLPDIEDVKIEGPENFSVKVKVGVSHIRGTMAIQFSILDKKEPVSTKLAGKGKGLGSAIDMTTSFTLEDGDSGGTRVNWRGDVNVAGRLSSFAPTGLLERVGKKNVEKFIDGIKEGIRKTGRSTT